MDSFEEREHAYPYYEDTVTESSWHLQAIHYLYGALRLQYRDHADVFVGSNNFVYWDQNDPEFKRAPDLYICFGARNIERASYRVWEEVVPQVVFEITSESSKFKDLGEKKGIYEVAGVEEYYLFDPTGDFLPGRFLAFRNSPGGFRPLFKKRVNSPRLGLDMRVEGHLLRLFLPQSSQRLLSWNEEKSARQEAESGRQEAEAARQEAEAARREAESGRQKAESALQRVDSARQQEVQARQAAEERALRAEQRLRELGG